MLRLIAATAALLLLTSPALARSIVPPAQEFCGDRYCGGYTQLPKRDARPHRVLPEVRCTHHGCAEAKKKPKARVAKVASQKLIHNHATRIVEHPAGCPRTRFCGCGVSLKVFGKVVTAGGLAIAKEWLRFPQADPAPGMVAARIRGGHVFYIEKVLGGGKVLAYDPNSGGHKTRIHVRSLAGYRVVNPRGGTYAAAHSG